MFYLSFLASLLLASVLLTRAMLAYATRRCLVDVPNERSSHDIPTPRGGGLSLPLVFLAGIMFFFCSRSFLTSHQFVALAGGAFLAAAVGFWDDHGGVRPAVRILVHFFAAAWVLFWLGGFPALDSGVTVSGVLQNIFWLVALVWFLNAYNFMDGIDGIAGAEALFISGAAAALLFLGGAHEFALAALVLCAAAAGFLFWNLPPARIFMGDVGSGFLGLILGAMAILTAGNGALNMWVWAILFGSFMTDATVTVFRRMLKGARWHAAHRSHAYQHAVSRFNSHGKITMAVTVINVLWLLPWAVAAWLRPAMGALFAVIAYAPLILLAIRFEAGVDDNFKGEVRHDRQPRTS
ncbi:MAG: glycosyltransferase family 4 protein [bacterium]